MVKKCIIQNRRKLKNLIMFLSVILSSKLLRCIRGLQTRIFVFKCTCVVYFVRNVCTRTLYGSNRYPI